ncbi:HHL048Cp [Eremothecium sinecaudum]|uniref:HHL048Cp n=1 Tax=Eremothecium sinecaudum TaxID=45286 RepID=A0A0X8HWF6_9SACH|nr:HHL048Cp [Eremothecium sinecaudum]AMD22722.1 HHL048Cp [Eremothecium sinecaudum]
MGLLESRSLIAETDEANGRFEAVLAELPYYTQLVIKYLPLLNNVCSQLLQILTENSLQVLINTVLGAPLRTDESRLFDALVDALEQIKMMYGNALLLNVSDIAPGIWFPGGEPPSILQGFECFILTTIRKHNLVVFILTLLGKFDYGFQFLNDCFIEVFCPSNSYGSLEMDKDNVDNVHESNGSGYTSTSLNSMFGGKLLKTHTVLYLNLKTQAFIAALDDTEVPADRKEVLDNLFPHDMTSYLQMKSSESIQEFQLTSSERDFITRCQRRREALESSLTLRDTMERYRWSDFLRDFLAYVSKNIGLLVFGKRGKGASSPFAEPTESALNTLKSNTVQHPSNENTAESSPIPKNGAPASRSTTPCQLVSAAGNSTLPTATETATPFTVLKPTIRKKPQQKRMWVKEEEDVLISALKMHGPSWSKILELHGAGGSISETLKNRSQVQLKDKARNWKMHYLKNRIPVPDYLLKVTGNLEREEKFKQRSKAKRKGKRLSNSSTNSPLA